MLTFGKLIVGASSAANYLDEIVPQDGCPAWAPSAQRIVEQVLGIDLSRPPTSTELARLLLACRADNGRMWPARTRRRTVCGFDFVLQPHKSVALALVFAPTVDEASAIWGCISRANNIAMELLASILGQARKGKMGAGGTEPGCTTWLSIRHRTAWGTLAAKVGRNGTKADSTVRVQGDPAVHIHNVLFNLVVTLDGRIGSLDSQRLSRAVVHLCGARFQVELACELRALGIHVTCGKDGASAVLPAVDSRAVEFFSKRNRVIGSIARRFAERVGRRWEDLSEKDDLAWLRRSAEISRLGGLRTLPNMQGWIEDASEIGWKHKSVVREFKPRQMSKAERIECACTNATAQAKATIASDTALNEVWLRVFAMRGLIGAGLCEKADIELVSEHLRDFCEHASSTSIYRTCKRDHSFQGAILDALWSNLAVNRQPHSECGTTLHANNVGIKRLAVEREISTIEGHPYARSAKNGRGMARQNTRFESNMKEMENDSQMLDRAEKIRRAIAPSIIAMAPDDSASSG
ncbi:MobF family relaxase [Belnapia moabensis]|uniref:MobF family relaxase n=1 Tax=Belnapia moabensis TaxID=365533 RepID=UPI0009FC0E6A|nr:MobF family relaxase [Belnapia moabensis]